MTAPQLPPPPPPLAGAPKANRAFVIAIAVVVIALASAAGLVIARNTSDDTSPAASAVDESTNSFAGDQTPPRANVDHFHAAYAVDLCGVEQSPMRDAAPDTEGIHTHGDGLIHIHPFQSTVAGDRATLSVFFNQVDLQLTDTTLTLPSGETRTEGRDQCDGKESELVVLVWLRAADADAGNAPDETHTTNMGDVRLRQGEAITIAFREGRDGDGADECGRASGEGERPRAADNERRAAKHEPVDDHHAADGHQHVLSEISEISPGSSPALPGPRRPAG